MRNVFIDVYTIKECRNKQYLKNKMYMYIKCNEHTNPAKPVTRSHNSHIYLSIATFVYSDAQNVSY